MLKKPLKGNRFGFTLIELIMVSVVVITAGLIIAPKLVDFLSAWDLETEARKLRVKIREVQQLSISKQKDYRLDFNRANESYSIIYDPNATAVTEETVSLGNNIGIDSTTFSSVGADELDFDIFGSPSEGGSIILIDTSGNTTTVTITAVTGKVEIE